MTDIKTEGQMLILRVCIDIYKSTFSEIFNVILK